MKHLNLSLLILGSAFWNLPADAQPTSSEQSIHFVAPITGGKFVEWYGNTGRTYFMQVSDPADPLNKWNWAPVIEAGNSEDISYEVDGTADKAFFRLQYTDQTATDLEAADFDNDGLTNLAEITPDNAGTQTNPLDADTDHDGLSDKWERDHGFDPNDDGTADSDNGPNGDPDRDGISNLQEKADETDPNNPDSDDDGLTDGDEKEIGSLPNNKHSDTDGVSDGQDADPLDPLVDWPRAGTASYVLIDIEDDGTHGSPKDLNDKGEVLYHNAIWSGGEWTELENPPDVAGAFPVSEEFDQEYQILNEQYGSYEYFDSAGTLVGSTAIALPGPGDALFNSVFLKPAGQSSQDLAATTLMPDYGSFGFGFGPLGILADRSVVSVLHYSSGSSPDFTYHSKIVISSGEEPNHEIRSLPNGSYFGYRYYQDRPVSPQGWIACHTQATRVSAHNGIAVWNPAGGLASLPQEASTNFANLFVTDLPDGPVPLELGKAAVIASTADQETSLVLLSDSAGNLSKSTRLSGKQLKLFAGDGTAMSADGRLWRNGKLIQMADLCPEFQELIDEEWTLKPLKANKHGVYLIEAEGPNGEHEAKLAMPVQILNYEKKPVSELTVADMEMSLTEEGYLILDEGMSSNFSGDPDRFYVRMPSLPGNHTISVKLSTVENENAEYDDDPTELLLHAADGGYESKSQALVSGAIDSEIYTAEKTTPENPELLSIHMRTHNVQLGGKVRITDLVIDGTAHAVDLKIPVPIKKIVKLNFVWIKDSDFPDIPAELKSTNEIFASTGIRVVKSARTVFKPPLPPAFEVQSSASELNYLDVRDRGRYISHYGTTNSTDDIHVFYVKQLFYLVEGEPLANHYLVQGFSVIEKIPGTFSGEPTPTAKDTGDANNVFIGNPRASFVTLAHELCHVLTNEGHYGTDYIDNVTNRQKSFNLMSGATRNHLEINSITAKKRIYEIQRAIIFNHWFTP